jgi:hypothetical protein
MASSFHQESNMDILSDITQKISALPTGETWEISARSLWLSHSDFHSIRIFLIREAEKGFFSILNTDHLASNTTATLQLIKH